MVAPLSYKIVLHQYDMIDNHGLISTKWRNLSEYLFDLTLKGEMSQYYCALTFGIHGLAHWEII